MAFVPLVSPPAGAAGPARWYLVRRSEILIRDLGGVPSGVGPPGDLGDLVEGAPVFIGTDDGVACWAQGVDPGSEAPVGTRWEPLLALGSSLPAPAWAVAGRAVQLVEWERTSRHCGRCGAATAVVPGERAMRCPECGLVAYPRLAPAAIVLVRRGRQALLARNAGFPGRMFSVLAGFVEPGESVEDAARREVAEEVGVELGAMEYVGSQPWPFPHSLMLGFMAEWASGEIRVDGREIAEAGWFTPEALPDVPPRLSIARTLIDRWVGEAGPG